MEEAYKAGISDFTKYGINITDKEPHKEQSIALTKKAGGVDAFTSATTRKLLTKDKSEAQDNLDITGYELTATNTKTELPTPVIDQAKTDATNVNIVIDKPVGEIDFTFKAEGQDPATSFKAKYTEGTGWALEGENLPRGLAVDPTSTPTNLKLTTTEGLKEKDTFTAESVKGDAKSSIYTMEVKDNKSKLPTDIKQVKSEDPAKAKVTALPASKEINGVKSPTANKNAEYTLVDKDGTVVAGPVKEKDGLIIFEIDKNADQNGKEYFVEVQEPGKDKTSTKDVAKTEATSKDGNPSKRSVTLDTVGPQGTLPEITGNVGDSYKSDPFTLTEESTPVIVVGSVGLNSTKVLFKDSDPKTATIEGPFTLRYDGKYSITFEDKFGNQSTLEADKKVYGNVLTAAQFNDLPQDKKGEYQALTFKADKDSKSTLLVASDKAGEQDQKLKEYTQYLRTASIPEVGIKLEDAGIFGIKVPRYEVLDENKANTKVSSPAWNNTTITSSVKEVVLQVESTEKIIPIAEPSKNPNPAKGFYRVYLTSEEGVTLTGKDGAQLPNGTNGRPIAAFDVREGVDTKYSELIEKINVDPTTAKWFENDQEITSTDAKMDQRSHLLIAKAEEKIVEVKDPDSTDKKSGYVRVIFDATKDGHIVINEDKQNEPAARMARASEEAQKQQKIAYDVKEGTKYNDADVQAKFTKVKAVPNEESKEFKAWSPEVPNTDTAIADNATYTATYQDKVTDKTATPEVDKVEAGATKVTGTAEAGSTVTVTFPAKEGEEAKTATAKAGNNGKYEVAVPEGVKLAEGDKVSVTAKAENKADSEAKEATVEKAAQEATNAKAPADKVKVADPANITQDDEEKILAAVKEANINLPEGTTYEIKDGKVIVTAPGKTPTELQISDLVEKEADKTLELKAPTNKVSVKDPSNLNDDEKTAVKNAVKDANTDLNLTDDQITVANDGAVRVVKDGKTGKLEPTQTITSETATVANKPEKTPVANPKALTDDEKAAVKKAVKDANPDLKLTDDQITVADNGEVTVKEEGKTPLIMTPEDTIIEKTKVADPAVTAVNVPKALTEKEKEAVKKAIEKANKGKTLTIEVKDDGTAIVTEEGKAPVTLEPTKTVKAKEATKEPQVDSVKPGDDKIKGTGVPGAAIEVKLPDGTVLKTTVGNDGKWSVDVPKDKPLKNGDKITVTQTEDGKAPASKEVTVKKPSTPSSGGSGGSYVEPEKPVKPTPGRVHGVDRIETAIQISQKYFDHAKAVIIVRHDLYPDSMTASVLSKVLNAPILLTRTNDLDKRVQDEIRRLGATEMIIVGGDTSVSNSVREQLKAFDSDKNVERIAGRDRYATSQAVARRVIGITGKKNTAVIASGELFPDALAIGPFAARENLPILLVKKDVVPQSVSKAIKDLDINKVYIVGGFSTVSSKAQAKLPRTIERIAGHDRYATALAIAKSKFNKSEEAFVASGEVFADALVISPVGGLKDQPILLVKHSGASKDVINYVQKDSKIKKLTVIGGTSLIPDSVVEELIKVDK